jgi:hypothetical protein
MRKELIFMKKTIKEWISYYEEHYGRVYRTHIEKGDEYTETYYWWDNMPEDILKHIPKQVWCRYYKDDYGVLERELVITY